jgi:hypothetical protein
MKSILKAKTLNWSYLALLGALAWPVQAAFTLPPAPPPSIQVDLVADLTTIEVGQSINFSVVARDLFEWRTGKDFLGFGFSMFFDQSVFGESLEYNLLPSISSDFVTDVSTFGFDAYTPRLSALLFPGIGSDDINGSDLVLAEFSLTASAVVSNSEISVFSNSLMEGLVFSEELTPQSFSATTFVSIEAASTQPNDGDNIIPLPNYDDNIIPLPGTLLLLLPGALLLGRRSLLPLIAK